mmetsp:Transcript_19908/g.33321  ORF Transcript_19908/g.33321 Transcript_19908/m.33321 type:complete len:546 (+) Transcript_19908:176-1813(+)
MEGFPSSNVIRAFWCFIVCFPLLLELCLGTPVSSPNWEELISTDGIKFSGRNAHASCVFKGNLWLTGGRTARYTTWDLLDSFKVADVWRTTNGGIWAQEEELTGDFFAQSTDVTQPGPIAPWYARYGHSMDPIDVDGDGEDDMMILMGGYASSPSNDIWITENGVHWVYAGLAPWSPRAWHSTTIFKGKLWMMGGTPLNNEVWQLINVTQVARETPLTRSMYSNYTYVLDWVRLPDAPWSPRVGMGLVSHWFFNVTEGEEIADSRERMVLAGGYGGFPAVPPTVALYDGFVTRPDTWHTYDGLNWTQLNWNNTFQGRAWFGMTVLHGEDPREQFPARNTTSPPKMYIVGGGSTGFLVSSKRRVTSMQGKADAFWSTDGQNWIKINYEEGGGTTNVPFFSSQEWTATVVDTNLQRLGKWGMTLHSFNFETQQPHSGNLLLIAGDYTDGGDFSPAVYRNLDGIYCDVNGIICNNRGTCGTIPFRCACDPGFTGDNCDGDDLAALTGAGSGASLPVLLRSSLPLSTLMVLFLTTTITFASSAVAVASA